MPASLSMTIPKVKATPKTMSNYENSTHSSPDIKFYDEYHHEKNKEKVMVSEGKITLEEKIIFICCENVHSFLLTYNQSPLEYHSLKFPTEHKVLFQLSL
mgnify:CR=1 FL=1